MKRKVVTTVTCTSLLIAMASRGLIILVFRHLEHFLYSPDKNTSMIWAISYGPTMIDEHQLIWLHYHCKLKDTSYTTVQLAWPSLRFAVRWRRNNIAYFPLTKIPGIPNGKSQIHRHAVFSVWLMEHSINEFSMINL